MRRTVAVLLALVIGGCSASSPAPRVVAGPPAPKVGDKVILKPEEMSDLWNDLDAMRKAERIEGEHDPAFFRTPEYKEMDSHRFGMASPGDLVELLEVGPDYAAVNVVANRYNEPVAKHGYTRAWWKR